MGDNNYPTPQQRENWENFLARVREAHPQPGEAAEKISAWERARDARDGTSEKQKAFEDAAHDALTPKQ